jgi:hypothetical protein
MPDKKESLAEKWARFEAWSERLNQQNKMSIDDLKNQLKGKPSTTESEVDPRLQAQVAITEATKQSAEIDERARERLRQIKKRY